MKKILSLMLALATSVVVGCGGGEPPKSANRSPLATEDQARQSAAAAQDAAFLNKSAEAERKVTKGKTLE